MNKLLIVFALVGMMLSACGPQSDSASLVGVWRLKALGPADDPQPALPDVDATLTFDDQGRMSGNVGCNGFGGDYKVAGDKITFGPVMSTMMYCDATMTQEQTALQILAEDVTYKIEGSTLTITKDGQVLVLEAEAAQ
jgi:heat shock protein HslJ